MNPDLADKIKSCINCGGPIIYNENGYKHNRCWTHLYTRPGRAGSKFNVPVVGKVDGSKFCDPKGVSDMRAEFDPVEELSDLDDLEALLEEI